MDDSTWKYKKYDGGMTDENSCMNCMEYRRSDSTNNGGEDGIAADRLIGER
jgi:hypothetical protein